MLPLPSETHMKRSDYIVSLECLAEKLEARAAQITDPAAKIAVEETAAALREEITCQYEKKC